MAATHMMLGQTEKTLRMAPNERFIGQPETLPTVKPRNDFQARHSFYPPSRVVLLMTLWALTFLSALRQWHLRWGKMFTDVKFSRQHVDTCNHAAMDCASTGEGLCRTISGI